MTDGIKLERFIGRKDLDVYSCTVAKFLYLRPLILSTIKFSRLQVLDSPKECSYCNIDLINEPRLYCKKHNGIWWLFNGQPNFMQIVVDDVVYLLAKNYVYFMSDMGFVLVHLPHFKISMTKYLTFLIHPDSAVKDICNCKVSDYYEFNKRRITDVTLELFNIDQWWTHIDAQKYVELNKIGDYEYEMEVRYYDSKMMPVDITL